MAYGCKYNAELQSHAGELWKISIYKNGYTSTTVTPLTLWGPDGFVLSYNGEGDDLHEPIKASDLKFSVTADNSTMVTFTTDIINGGSHDFIVKLEKWDVNAIPDPAYTFQWGGVLTHEVTEVPDQYQYVVEITAIDGLSTLNDITMTTEEFEDIASVTLDFYVKPSELVRAMLAQLPWVSTFAPTFAIRWSDDWSALGIGTSYWQNTVFINLKVFAEYNERTSKYDLKSFYDILQEVVSSCNSEIFLWQNFTIINKDYRRTTEARACIYFDGATVLSTSTEGTEFDILQQRANARLAGGKFMYRQPVKKVRKKITYKNNSSANNNQTIYDQVTNIGVQLVGTTFVGSGDLVCEAFSSDDVAKLKVSYDFGYHLKTTTIVNSDAYCVLKLNVKIVNGGVTYYLSGNSNAYTAAQWVTSSAARYSIVSNPTPSYYLNDPPTHSYFNGDFINTFTIDLPFTTGVTQTTISLDFDSFYYIGATYTLATTTEFYSVLANRYIYLEPLNSDNEQTVGFATFSSVATNGNDLIYDLPDGLLHDGSDGTGIFYNNNTGAFSIVPATITRTTKWYEKSVGTSTAYYLPEMCCRSIHRYTYKPLRLFQGTVVNSGVAYNDTLVIDYDTYKLYLVFNGGQFTGKTDRWAGEWWAVRQEAQPETAMETADNAPFSGVEVSRGASSHPYTLGGSSKISDHLSLGNFILEYKTQGASKFLGGPAGTSGYPDYRTPDLSEFPLKGSSTGAIYFSSGATGTTNYNVVFQAKVGTVAYLSDVGTSGGGYVGTSKSIPFVGTTGYLTEDADNFVWDNANKRAGFGTKLPNYRIEAAGKAVADGVRSWMGFDIYPVTAPASISGSVGGGGSVDTGDHYYLVSYYTDTGETTTKLSAKITTTAGQNTVVLTIPVSTDSRVVGRKLYRTKAGAAATQDYALATVADNTSTTYSDTAADSTLSDGPQKGYFRPNTTTQFITLSGSKVMQLDTEAVSLGVGAAGSGLTGGRHVAIGYRAGYSVTLDIDWVAIGNSALYSMAGSGSGNIGVGYQVGYYLTTGGNTSAIGYQALYYNSTGDYNTALGSQAFKGATTKSFSAGVAVGYRAGYANEGNYNTYVGAYAGYTAASVANGIHIGYYAGRYETVGAKLIIDAFNRTNEANQRLYAIIYGVMSSTQANQILSLGGGGKVGINNTAPNSTFHVTGSEAHTLTQVSTTYTATATDNIIEATSGTFTINLPTAVNIAGREYTVANSGAGTVTVDPNGTETIGGSATYALAGAGTSVTFYSNNANWLIKASK